jgi:hypothetical protein
LITRRRAILAASATAAAAALARPAFAADFTYREWRINADAVKASLPDELIQSFQAQIDMVESLAIKPEIKAFFRSVACFIDETTQGGPGAYGAPRRRMILSTHPQPRDNPVFLHELLHAYHHQVLPNGFQNPTILAFWKAAKASKQFPSNAYMLEDQLEFFAMCASVALWGKAARPPMTRANLRQKLPDVHDWIAAEFGIAAAWSTPARARSVPAAHRPGRARAEKSHSFAPRK